MSYKWLVRPLALLVCLALLPACSLPQAQPALTDTSVPVATATESVFVEQATSTALPIVHLLIPGEPPGKIISEISDRDSSATASERRANGGENFASNLFERPFNANTMDTYFPDLDILRAALQRDDTWLFLILRLAGTSPDGGMSGAYGLEFDLDVDGRGDFLILATAPGAEWSTNGVRVWTDNNNDVGGKTPAQADTQPGDGYETLLFDSGVGSDPDLAWGRISPSDPTVVQVAFKRSLIENDGVFTWGAWTERSVLTPGWYDYNDHFTPEDVGSPLAEQTKYYPIKALAELDNTCRWGVGFTPSGSEPGVCPKPVTPTPPPPVGPGTISGTVYYNGINGGLSYVPGVSTPQAGIPVTLRSGDCGSPGGVVDSTTSNVSGKYSFSVGAGTYCVSFNPPSSYRTGPQTVTISGGDSATVDFFYYTYLGLR